MSFFAAHLKALPTKRVSYKDKQIASYNQLGCIACPLNKVDCRPSKLGPKLALNTEVLFLAGAPGRKDDSSRKALTGAAGSVVRSCIPEGKEGICSFDHVVNCRPREDWTPEWTETECCRPRRISVVEKTKPKLIIGLGVGPLSLILKSGDLVNLRGRMFAVKIGTHECYFMPTYDPEYVLEQAYDKEKPLFSKLGFCFRMDIENAFKGLGKRDPVHIETEQEIRGQVSVYGVHQANQVLSLLGDARQRPVKSIDLETSCLRPYSDGAKILSVALSFDDVNFAFPLDHPQVQWDPRELKAIKQELVRLLQDDTTKVAHNTPFEVEWLARILGVDCINHAVWECTMLQAHFLDERKGGLYNDDNTGANRYLGLAFLSKAHFGVDYKAFFQLNKKDMASTPLEEMLIYNAVDTKFTLQLYHEQTRLLKERGLWDAYLEAAPRQPTVGLMQNIGVPVDQTEVMQLQVRFAKDIEEIRAAIESQEVIIKYKEDHAGNFNPMSGPDTLSIFKDYLKRDEVRVVDGTKLERYSTDKNVLDKIDHPLAQLIVKLRYATKMKSTYVDELVLGVGEVIYPDGKLHTTYHTTGTETGRLSSSKINLQNFPKRAGADMRRTVIAPEGHVLIAVDYSQLEGCTTAMCSRDNYYVKALTEDYDTHMVWAKRLAELVPGCTKQVDGKFRSMVKNKLVFPAFFGATVDKVTQYLGEGCGQPIPKAKVEQLMEEFWDAFSGVRRWQKRLMKQYYRDGYVETLGGRRRNYPLTRNEVYNTPIQGTGAELVCDAMVRLSYLAMQTGRPYVHPVLNVHDDLSFIVPSDRRVVDRALEIIVTEMLTFRFPWVNVPLALEVSMGPNWCDLKSLGKFRSDEL